MATIFMLLPSGLFSKMSIFACGITKNAFATKLVQEFAKKEGISIGMNRKGGVPFVIKAVKDGTADIGIGCRTAFRHSNEKGIWSIQVAWGALAFIVNEKNPVKNITIKQAKNILIGKIRNWKEVGGWDSPINLYIRSGKNSGVGFSARVLLFQNIKQTFYAEAVRKDSSAPIRKAVKQDKNSFGIDDFTSSRFENGLKILKINGIEASKKNILNKRYELARPYYIYSKGRPSGINRKFISFAQGLEGQNVISKIGVVTVKEAKGAVKLNRLLSILKP